VAGPAAGRPDVVQAPDLDGVVRLHTLVPLALKGQTRPILPGYPVAPLYAKAYGRWSGNWYCWHSPRPWHGNCAVGNESLFMQPLHG